MSLNPARVAREFPSRYRLEAAKCAGCGHVAFPARLVCPACRGTKHTAVTLDPAGKLLTFTVIHVPPAEFKGQAPYVLAVVELAARRQEEKGKGPFVPILYVLLGTLALGLHTLAGHAEILVYTILVTAYYALARLLFLARRVGSWRPALRLALWFALMGGLGLALGSVQLIPLLELVTRNFREGSVAYADVAG